MKRTTADVPPQAAAEFSKARRPEAIAEADASGYAKTKKMQKGQQPPSKSQYGLPKSPGLHLRISVRPDTDGDKM